MDIRRRSELREVAVDGGWIRLHEHRPERPTGRPVVFAPGFSAPVEVWQEAFEVLVDQVPLVVVETLEKGTTRTGPELPPLSPGDLARQLAVALEGLEAPVLFASSWLATSLLQGASEGTLRAPTMVAFDPLPVFWVPSFIPRWSIRFLPAALLGWLRAPLAWVALLVVHQPKQRARFRAIVDAADPRRWKRAALDALDTDLLDGRLERTQAAVWVVNGSDDPIHPAADLRRIAEQLPGGRYERLDVPETRREGFAGQVALAFARAEPGQEPDWEALRAWLSQEE